MTGQANAVMAPPSDWVVRWSDLVRPGTKVLDVACGGGRALEAVPDNNHYAALYSSQTYSQQQTLSNALLFVAVAAVFVMVLTLFVGSKRISTEMLTVIQVAYASLLTAPKVSPLFSAVTSLSAANNGYNLMYSTQLRPFEDTLVGSRAKGA